MCDTAAPLRQGSSRLPALACLAALLLVALPAAARAQPPAPVLCPLQAAELSSILGKAVQRVNLSDPGGDPAAQCAFSATGKPGRTFVGPQVFLTVDPGAAADLHGLEAYYLKSRSELATRPQVDSRPDLGPGAFTLTSSTSRVSTVFFLIGKAGIGTLTVDLTDAAAGRRELSTVDRVFALVHARLR